MLKTIKGAALLLGMAASLPAMTAEEVPRRILGSPGYPDDLRDLQASAHRSER